jgi:hypothetical protein
LIRAAAVVRMFKSAITRESLSDLEKIYRFLFAEHRGEPDDTRRAFCNCLPPLETFTMRGALGEKEH